MTLDRAFANYSVQVQWDGTNWTEEWSRVKKMTISRGREKGVLGSPMVGQLVMVMKNSDLRFSPANADGDLYGDLLPGKAARVRAMIGQAATLDGDS